MATFSHHESCPACKSRDNLARYDDGSAFCFGCRYYEPPTGRKTAAKAAKRAYSASPDEVSTLPSHMVERLTVMGLTPAEQALFKYSPRMDRLIFRDGDFCEARAFDGRTPKTLSFGSKPFHVFGEGSPITCVEDVFSAIRVGRVSAAVPLFGSVIPKDWMTLLTRLTKDVILWLDADKYKEALVQARTLRLIGLNVAVVVTELDPKHFSTVEVQEVLDNGKKLCYPI